MPTLPNFTQFEGNYWDTGSIRNALDYQGVIAPHTGKPYDEAMLLGISGGIAFGYFTFHYKGYDPQVNLLTRNTFDPMQRIFERLGIEVKMLRTASVERMRKNLVKTLESGNAPIARPDMYLLPYNCLGYDEANWGTMPLVVFGYDEGGDAMISDRSTKPLSAPTEDFDKAMSRVKKDRHGLMLLGEPDNERLPEAIRAGLRDTVSLMLEKPPKGAARNFGIKALQHWQDMLSGSGKGSWKREYGSGRAAMAAHTSAYRFLSPCFGKTWKADRDLYADFLRQAADVLGEGQLRDVAARYDTAAKAWEQVIHDLLPIKYYLFERANIYLSGAAMGFIALGMPELDIVSSKLWALQDLLDDCEHDFDITDNQMDGVREQLRKRVITARRAENRAVLALQEVCATMGD